MIKTIVLATSGLTKAQDVFLGLKDDCPGGSLQACIDMCPTDATAFKACVVSCQDRCTSTTTLSPSPSPSPSPAPTPSPSPTPSPTPPPSPSPAPVPGTCTSYSTGAANCDNNCGNCFNPGARSGVLINNSQTGYYSDAVFACMDWTFGSVAMRTAEAAFNKRTNEDVFFGVGTFGTGDDAQRGLGACYRIEVDGMEKDLLVQSINTGSDVSGFQFDLMIGDGGAGAYDSCAGGDASMYPGPYNTDTWGKIYGGFDNREQCQNLPAYPKDPSKMKAAGDDLITLCEYGFDHGARHEGGGNPNILKIGRVECPAELVEFTWIQREDDPTGFDCGADCTLAAHECQASSPGASLEWCLTRMMDCRKPSGAFKDNIVGNIVVEGKKLVQTCTADGYTRVDVQCGCLDCYC